MWPIPHVENHPKSFRVNFTMGGIADTPPSPASPAPTWVGPKGGKVVDKRKHIPARYLDRLSRIRDKLFALRFAIQDEGLDPTIVEQLELVERELERALMWCNRSDEERALLDTEGLTPEEIAARRTALMEAEIRRRHPRSSVYKNF